VKYVRGESKPEWPKVRGVRNASFKVQLGTYAKIVDVE
jgi:hypothetical protein